MDHLLHELMPFISHYGLWIVFFGMMVEGMTMIIITGILCYLSMLTPKEAIPVAIIGAIIGDQFWYIIGRYYSDTLLKKVPLFRQKIQKLSETIRKKGAWLSFGGRFIYGGAILFPLGLGTYRYPHIKFTLFNTLGIVLWSSIGALVGYFLASGTEAWIGKLEKIWHFCLLGMSIVMVIWIIRYYIVKKNNRVN